MEAWKGLNNDDVARLQKQYGQNYLHSREANRNLQLLIDVVSEPMFLMLVVACSLYFILGETTEGLMMITAICFVTAISVYQELKSSSALAALRQLTQPQVKVIRNGEEVNIDVEQIVPGDIVIMEEGDRVPADAVVLQQNDFSVDESIITGESLPAEKKADGDNLIYQGCTINSGKCYARILATGNDTVLGKLGKSIAHYSTSRTLLQVQVSKLVQKLALFGLVAFVIIFVINYIHSHHIISSFLFGLTLAMAAIPEEIPVAFSYFMALGAYYMSKRGIITRQPQTIEYLGAVTVVCIDKTGTITENKMQVKNFYDFRTDRLVDIEDRNVFNKSEVLRWSVLASEQEPFDAMEKAIWKAYLGHHAADVSLKMVYEYPLEGTPPMMTHVYASGHQIIAAAKGAPERIIKICHLEDTVRDKIYKLVDSMSEKGFRILGVASALHREPSFPASQNDFKWEFEGLVSLYDPPKQNIKSVLQKLYNAGISIKLLTGDHIGTALNISSQVGLQHETGFLTGEQVLNMDDQQLQTAVQRVHVFARMFPDAKLKVIEAIKANNDIVAMSGDGVNDGPAIKAAQIGIAMGKRGTEIARQAADLILTNDDLDMITEAIAQGRKIFNNLRKAVRYIISIHIPIILTAFLPLIFGWKYPNIFTPIHIIFLELIMGPTCSVFFEREPVEENLMHTKPVNRLKGLFDNRELMISIFQGLVITIGVLLLYYIYMQSSSLELTRSMVFTTLILSNIFLTFINRSFSESILATIRYRNNLALPILIISTLFLVLVLCVPAIRTLFELSLLSSRQFFLSMLTAIICTGWFEVYKAHQ